MGTCSLMERGSYFLLSARSACVLGPGNGPLIEIASSVGNVLMMFSFSAFLFLYPAGYAANVPALLALPLRRLCFLQHSESGHVDRRRARRWLCREILLRDIAAANHLMNLAARSTMGSPSLPPVRDEISNPHPHNLGANQDEIACHQSPRASPGDQTSWRAARRVAPRQVPAHGAPPANLSSCFSLLRRVAM